MQVLPRYLLSMPSFIFAGVESSRGQGRGPVETPGEGNAC